MGEMGFDEASTPIVKGSALCALEDTKPELGVDAINELMNVVDESIPTPERDLDVPFLMPIDHVHNIQGRGCVITGRMERGKLKTGQDVEVIGYGKSAKGKVTGIEMFHKILEEANAGDQMGLLARGIKSADVARGMCVVKPKSVKACDQFVAQVYLMTPEEGGRKKPCTKDMQLVCFSKTWDCAAFVELEGKEMAMPGEDAAMHLRKSHRHKGQPDRRREDVDADEQGEESKVFGKEGSRHCISPIWSPAFASSRILWNIS